MKCPTCHSHSLTDVNLDTGLLAQQCRQCFGHWISAESYRAWLDSWEQDAKSQARERAGNRPSFSISKVSSLLPVIDNTTANFCADCDRLMTKAKVGHGLSFYLDRCSHCHGVWLDQHEWENLRRMELHHQIHYMFSSGWQFSMRKEQSVQKAHTFQKTPA